jgi:hypothetical protein
MSNRIGPRTFLASSTITALLCCASLVLNGLLAARFFRPVPPLPEINLPPEPGRRIPGRGLAPTAAQPTLAPAPATDARPPFLWNQIESADYREYIANLRAVGCPEEIIRDIIAADLSQLFAPRAEAIWKPSVRKYWEKPQHEQPSPAQQKQLMALEKERATIFKELLGVRSSQQELVDTMYLQLHGSERELLFLPPDKREAALQALADSDFEEKEMKAERDRSDWDKKRRKLYEEKMSLLAKVLSPAELDEFRLRNSGVAQNLRTEIQYFDCTPEEFKALLQAREATAKGREDPANLLDRKAATEEVRKLFGEERAKEFERVTDMFYINARRVVEDEGLPVDRAEQVWQITRDARAASEKLAKNTGLAPEERNRQAQAVRQQADARLTELLGPKRSRAVSRDLGVVLRAPGANPGP